MRKPCYIFILAVFSFCCFKTNAQDDPPNIVLIVADDLGYGDLSCYGSAIPTPNIDRLANEGVRFTTFYSNGAECTPTRAALMTGRYQQRIGGLECAIGLNGIGRYPEAALINNSHDLGLPVTLNAIPSILKKVGYNTALIGKWHLGYEPKFQPKAHGFDFSFGPLGGGVNYFLHCLPVGRFIGHDVKGAHDLYRNGHEISMDGYYLTDLLTDLAVNWINNQKKGKPFFLFVPYTAVHKPYQGPDDYSPENLTVEEEGMPNKEAYIAMVEALDKGVGQIMTKLKEEGMSENTIVIFTSDNGPSGPGSSGPFRDNKGTLFEGGIRVPCIVKWPGHIKPGTVSEQMGITMDLTASITRIAGASAPQGLPFDGVDIIKDIEENEPVYPRTLFWRKQRMPRVVKAVHDANMKYLSVKNGSDITEYLFNLKDDPQEKDNLINKYPDEAGRLNKLLTNWEGEVSPNYWEEKLGLTVWEKAL